MGILDFLKRKKPLEERTSEPVVCDIHISPETNRWNKLALKLIQERENNSESSSNPNPEYLGRRRQEETYREN